MSENGEIYTAGNKFYTPAGTDGMDKFHLCNSATLVLQHGDISACLVNELDMKEIVIISEKMAGPWNPRDQVLVKYEELRETCPALPQNLRPFQVNHHHL